MTVEPLSYRFYRALTDGARPLAHMMLLERSRRNKEDRTRLGERRGKRRVVVPRVRLFGFMARVSVKVFRFCPSLKRWLPKIIRLLSHQAR